MTLTRRGFLAGLGGAAAGGALVGAPLWSRLLHAEPTAAPTRLLVIHKPAGTHPAAYDCAGDPSAFTLSHILDPFADLREHMTLVEGLEVKKAANTPGEDHANAIVTFMTGGVPFKPPGSNDALAERISIDQILAAQPAFGSGVPIRSLQLTADDRALQFGMRVLSYAGRGAPMPAEQSPRTSFARVFGTLGDRPLTADELARVRTNRQSVLDFTRRDLARLQHRAPAESRARLDRHLQAIREVEQVLHQTIGRFDTSGLRATVDAVDARRRDELHAAIGRAHLDVVRAAFQCDLTRIACFQWGSMELNFSHLLPGFTDLGYHLLSHYAGNEGPDLELAEIHRWYNVELAAFLRTLRDTPDFDGHSLLHNTLVVVWSEMRKGSHSFDNLPIQLFGNAGGRLRSGRLVRFPGKTTNDLWLTIARSLGVELPAFGDADRGTGVIEGLMDLPLVRPTQREG